MYLKAVFSILSKSLVLITGVKENNLLGHYLPTKRKEKNLSENKEKYNKKGKSLFLLYFPHFHAHNHYTC